MLWSTDYPLIEDKVAAAGATLGLSCWRSIAVLAACCVVDGASLIRSLPMLHALGIGKTKNRRGKYPDVLNHVGLLANRPPGISGLPFIQSSD